MKKKVENLKRPALSLSKGNRRVVFVGLSGGVDSSVSAALLKAEGYEVVGVFIKTWHPEYLPCNEEDERRDAMRVAAHLGIPFLTFDLEDVYKKEVADYMIREYKAGRTPNPDVMCNKYVKFGAFLKKAINMGADYVATGHYAQTGLLRDFSGFLQSSTETFPVQNLEATFLKKKYLDNSSSGRVHLKSGGKLNNFLGTSLIKGKDSSKDQSYFLWTLTQEQLSRILFPVGNLEKSEVRKLARKFKLPVAEKKDSQGICFLGQIDLKEFLKHYIKEKRGVVLNEKGEKIGYHSGAMFHTLGERHGFTITKKNPNDMPYYIVEKDVKKNILIVSPNRWFSHSTTLTNYRIENTNWINELPKPDKSYTAQIRYHGELLSCMIKVKDSERNRRTEVVFDKTVLVASGQSVVFYDQDICLGGGIIA